MTIEFTQTGSITGAVGGGNVINNPTSLQFGPDGRLYVSEQNGSINAFTIELQNGQYVATDHEQLTLPNGDEVVRSIQNHNDDGSLADTGNRQVTGIMVAGDADNPVLYVSSSDPRISQGSDVGLDTNSGVITQVTWTGTEWEAIDIVRGLPRSEENHANNGLEMGPDGTKLYVAVGGNTNNGAPSDFFGNTGEYALSGTILEIDLTAINALPVQTDPNGGQDGEPRLFVYDLPTFDDPTVPNDGVLEDANGNDVNGPWGGNDGFNMAILPADAPITIFADGFRNHYDLEFTQAGNLYTVDNGSNGNLGDYPVIENGEATNQIANGGPGNPEPLFLIEQGEYYGHPVPVRSNQDLAWTVFNDDGDPDGTLDPNTVADISTLVPDGVDIADGFIIDPSRFTGDAARLLESGIGVPYTDAASPSLLNIGSSSNGLVEYTGGFFEGALDGDLLVAQFNGNVGRLDLTANGTQATYSTINGLTGLSLPLDVTTGPDGTVWVAEFGDDLISVFSPEGDGPPDPVDADSDGDGIANAIDPFLRDASNGANAVLNEGETLTWDFDANQDGNLEGPSGFGGGLTGVMIDGVTDFEAFFQEDSPFADQDIKLDNVKFITAAGGGTTVIENVSVGDAFQGNNSGEYLFHTGVTIDPDVDTFTVKWTVFNPGDALSGNFQQIGGYIGTGDQSNYLKVVAIQSGGEINIVLEDEDGVELGADIQADGLFDVAEADGKQIFIELEIDKVAQTATPTITYETANGPDQSVAPGPISIAGTNVLEAINGNHTVDGQTTGLAVGLFSSNVGQPQDNTFQAIFDGIEITADGDIVDPPPPGDVGSALIQVTPNAGVQTSSFGNQAIQIENTGDKQITSVTIDLSEAAFQDMVFDPFGVAGDDVAAALNEGVGFAAVGAGDPIFGGPGGVDGFNTFTLNFTNFDVGEFITFGTDMDPNSIAGLIKGGPDDVGGFDHGGVSGLEISNAVITFTFADGSTATTELIGDGSDGGAAAFATEEGQGPAVQLTVDGLNPGGAGDYDPDGANPQVIISGEAGLTARVVVAGGLVTPPVVNGVETLSLIENAAQFPANNAFQTATVDVVLTGGNQNITNLVANTYGGFDGEPLVFTAAIIDDITTGNGALVDAAIGPVTTPIYLIDEGDVGPGNQAPNAINDGPFNVGEDDGATAFDVLANDTDGDGDALTVAAVNTEGTLGEVTINANGTVSYNPNGQFDNLNDGETATDTFTYTASDGNGGADTATVTVNIQGADDGGGPPADNAFTLYLINADTNQQIAELPADGVIDPDLMAPGQSFSIQAVINDNAVDSLVFNYSGSINGTQTESYEPFVMFGDGNGGNNIFGQPFPEEPFTLNVTAYSQNGGNGQVVGTPVTQTITPDDGGPNENQAPTAVDDGPFEISEDAGATAYNVLANDTDPDGDALTVISVNTAGTTGEVTINGNGTVSYDPNGQFEALDAGQIEQDSFEYTISDGNGGTSTATVPILVFGVDDGGPPAENAFTLYLVDADTDEQVAVIPANGVIDPDLMAPGQNFSIQAVINPGNDVESVVFEYSGSINGDQTENFEPYAMFADTNAGGGNRNITGEPFPDGPFQLTVTAYSGNGGNGQVVGTPVTQTITPGDDGPNDNQAPNAVNDGPFQVGEDAGATAFNVLANDTDGDGDQLTVIGVNTAGTDGTVTINGNGTISYNPNGQFEGLDDGETATDTFQYTISDGEGGTDTATVSVTINGADEDGNPPAESAISLFLYDSGTDQLIGEVPANGVIDPATLPTGEFTLVAEIGNGLDGDTDSVVFEYSGSINGTKIENKAPYAMFGNVGDEYEGVDLPDGPFTVTVSAYTGGGGGGQLVTEPLVLTISPGAAAVAAIAVDEMDLLDAQIALDEGAVGGFEGDGEALLVQEIDMDEVGQIDAGDFGLI